MKKAHKKRPPRATANSPPGLSDMGKIYFINLVIYKVNTRKHANSIFYYITNT